jgi:hypothetical protein
MLKVRKIEILVEDGLVVLEADGTPGWISVTAPSGAKASLKVADETIGFHMTLDELARRILVLDHEPNPDPRRVAYTIVQIAPVIW